MVAHPASVPRAGFGLALALCILATACGGGTGEDTGAVAAEAMAVDAARAEKRRLEISYEAVGTIEAVQAATVAAEVDGVVAEVALVEGAAVAADALLLRLDDATVRLELDAARARLAEAEAALAEAEDDRRRQARLWERKATTEEQFTRAGLVATRRRADLEGARTAVALAEERLSKTVLRAPFAGVLGESAIDPGDFVAAGMALVDVVRLDPIEVRMTVPERWFPRLATGLPAYVLDPTSGEEVEGKVTYVAPTIDPTTRTVTAKASLPNPTGRFGPGMFVRARLVLDVRENAVVVPEAALVPRAGSWFVYSVDEDGKARRHEVTPGQRLRGELEIVAGLEGNETVVVGGQQRIADGHPVRVRD